MIILDEDHSRTVNTSCLWPMQHAECRLDQALDSLLGALQTYRATGPGILLILPSLLGAKPETYHLLTAGIQCDPSGRSS